MEQVNYHEPFPHLSARYQLTTAGVRGAATFFFASAVDSWGRRSTSDYERLRCSTESSSTGEIPAHRNHRAGEP